jgi:hypothetical protein
MAAEASAVRSHRREIFPAKRIRTVIFSATPCLRCEQWAYRLAWPRTIFFILRLADPRACVRACSGFSALRFFRDARRTFLRSSLLLLFVFAIGSTLLPY